MLKPKKLKCNVQLFLFVRLVGMSVHVVGLAGLMEPCRQLLIEAVVKAAKKFHV